MVLVPISGVLSRAWCVPLVSRRWQIAQLHDLAAGDLLVAIAGYGAFRFQWRLLLDIGVTLKDLLSARVLIPKLLPTWRMGVQGAAAEAFDGRQMSSADLVQRRGRVGVALLDKLLDDRDQLFDRLRAPRLICFSASSAKKRST